VQLAQDWHVEPVQNSLPLRHSMQRASWVPEHGDAVYLPTPVQLVHVTHTVSCVPEHGDAVYLPTAHAVQQRASRVSEHDDAVYLPMSVQLLHVTHVDPVQNSRPLRHPPAARTPAAAAEEDVGGRCRVVPGRDPKHGGAVSSAVSSASRARTPTRGMAGRPELLARQAPAAAGLARGRVVCLFVSAPAPERPQYQRAPGPRRHSQPLLSRQRFE